MANDIRMMYEGEFGDEYLLFDQNILQALFVNTEDQNWNKVDPDLLVNESDITKDGVYEFLKS